jgi:ATP-dependent protease ClpP protease subunit
MNWFTITHHDGNASTWIYSDLGCYGSTADDFVRELGDAQRVEIFLDSTGGCSHVGQEISEAVKNRSVSVTVTGNCWSSAIPILMAAKDRTAYSDACFLIHAPSAYTMGKSATLRTQADELDSITAKIADALVLRTGQSPETVARWLGGETKFTAQEALAVGLIDAIIPRPPAPKARSSTPSAMATIKPQTESEKFFNAFLLAVGKVEVANREKFMGELYQWAVMNVKQV